MSDNSKLYGTGLGQTGEMICARDKVPLVPRQVTLSYMNSAFPVELPACPVCGMMYIPEELAIGKILHVEKSLEDK